MSEFNRNWEVHLHGSSAFFADFYEFPLVVWTDYGLTCDETRKSRFISLAKWNMGARIALVN